MQFNESATLHTAHGPQALRVRTARGFWGRFRGLMLTAPLSATPSAQALLIPRCPSVHGFFMRYALDVVYLASEHSAPMPTRGSTSYLVTHISHLKPWRFSMGKRWQPPVGSEVERQLGVPERTHQSAVGKAQSTAVARATARICNAAGGVLGCQGGHDRLPLSLSGQGQPLRSQHALELPAGSIASLGIQPGDRLEVQT